MLDPSRNHKIDNNNNGLCSDDDIEVWAESDDAPVLEVEREPNYALEARAIVDDAFMDAGRKWPPKSMAINRNLAEYKAINLENTADAVITEIRTETTGYKAESLYPRIKSPCLVMLGNPDLGGLVEHRDRKRLASILSHASIKELPNAGHGLHTEAEEDFVKHLDQFLISLD